MSLDVSLYLDIDSGADTKHRCELFEANITHNLAKMARLAGAYDYVWHPNQCSDVEVAADLINPLEEAISAMEAEPQKFKKLNPENGWGSYEVLLDFLKSYAKACSTHSKCKIHSYG